MILITNLMHWLLFIHKILFSSTCFEPQVLIFRRIQLCTCSIWYCHSLWEFLVACRYTAWVRTDCRGKVVGGCLKTRKAPRIWRDFGSALPFQTRLTQTKPVLPLSNEHGSQVKDQGRRQCCHNKQKKFPYRPTRDVSLLSGRASYFVTMEGEKLWIKTTSSIGCCIKCVYPSDCGQWVVSRFVVRV